MSSDSADEFRFAVSKNLPGSAGVGRGSLDSEAVDRRSWGYICKEAAGCECKEAAGAADLDATVDGAAVEI